MTKYFALLIGLVVLVSSCNADNKGVQNAGKDVKLTTTMDSVSYILGVNLGSQLKQSSLVPNIDAVAAGITDALADKPKLDEKTRQQVIQAFVAVLQEKAMKKQEAEQAKMKEEAPKNLAAGQKFLEENKTKPGIKVTESGLQYKIINAGNANKPKPTDQVTVHYKGSLIDGTEFDNSYSRGNPSTFQLNGVIPPGWTEGLQLIGEGGKMIMYIPSNIGYGEQGMGNTIPPNSVLIFEVELVKIGK